MVGCARDYRGKGPRSRPDIREHKAAEGGLACLNAKRLRLTQSLETIAPGLRAGEHKALDDRSFLVGKMLPLPSRSANLRCRIHGDRKRRKDK